MFEHNQAGCSSNHLMKGTNAAGSFLTFTEGNMRKVTGVQEKEDNQGNKEEREEVGNRVKG